MGTVDVAPGKSPRHGSDSGQLKYMLPTPVPEDNQFMGGSEVGAASPGTQKVSAVWLWYWAP